MLTKINFPREAVLIAGLGVVIFNFLIRLGPACRGNALVQSASHAVDSPISARGYGSGDVRFRGWTGYQPNWDSVRRCQ